MQKTNTSLHFLDLNKIQAVIDDLRLEQAGYRLYYAIDPYEVFNFCFPLHTANNADSRGEPHIDEFAADQAALYEICFKHKEKPLLVGDYVDEMSGLMNYSANVLSSAYDEAGVVDALMERGGVEDISGQPAEKDLAETVRIISEKFHIVLAVVMGIYSIGADRFRQVYRDLVTNGKGVPANNPDLHRHFESYRETELCNPILQEITKHMNDEEFRKKRLHAYFDAKAIDLLIHVNTSLLRGKNGPPSLVMYLSSARRTGRAFGMKATKECLPQLEGKPFNFHRDRNHIFYYVAYRSDDGLEQTIENLERVKTSVLEINKLDSPTQLGAARCSQCVLDGLRPTNCDMAPTCEHIKTLLEPIERRSAEIRNLGFTQTLSQYQELMAAEGGSVSQENLMGFFRRIFEDETLKNVATQKKLEKEKLIFLQSITPKMWSRSREAAGQQHLRAGRDPITGSFQYLPLKPQVGNQTYREIVSLVLSYYRTPPQGDVQKIEVIDRAYGLYLDQEALTTDLNPHHELVRCLLYLTIPSTDGDRRAYEHALEMLELPSVLSHVQNAEAEYRYIACWAARRLKRFADANAQAVAGMKKWPSDPRFYNGRSLSKLSEWTTISTPTPEDAALLTEAEADALKAIELYSEKGEENREFIGANYNNLTYLYTVKAQTAADGEAARECLAKARECMNALREWVPEEEWVPISPNYFHTDALLDYYEAINGSAADKIATLEHAALQINKAMHYVGKKDTYVKLDNVIKNALSRLK